MMQHVVNHRHHNHHSRSMALVLTTTSNGTSNKISPITTLTRTRINTIVITEGTSKRKAGRQPKKEIRFCMRCLRVNRNVLMIVHSNNAVSTHHLVICILSRNGRFVDIRKEQRLTKRQFEESIRKRWKDRMNGRRKRVTNVMRTLKV